MYFPCNNADREGRASNNQAFDVDMVEITPTPVDENCYRNTALDTGSENRLNNKNISPLQEVLQWPNTLKRRVKRITMNMVCVIT